jgi:dienelactone hydrolase
MSRRLCLAAVPLAALLLAGCANQDAEIMTKEITYEHAGDTLVGYLARPANLTAPRPGILLIHEWWGRNEYAQQRARELAALGYVAFAADVYGDAETTDDPQQASQWAGRFYNDRALFRARLTAGLEQLRQQPDVDSSRLAAIGYCFGGNAVIELALSGADLAGVVSFHGGLSGFGPATDNPPAELLILNGAIDPLVSAEDRQNLQQTLDDANAKWTMVEFSGAKHSFTNPKADAVGMDAVAYDARADERSWAYMQAFFDELFAE